MQNFDYMQTQLLFRRNPVTNLAADGVKIYPYEDVYSYVQTVAEDKKILLSKANVNSRLVSNIPCNVTIVDEPNLTLLPKAVKIRQRWTTKELHISKMVLQLQNSFAG